MKKSFITLLTGFFAPVAAIAVNEGVPSYYQTQNAPNANQAAYSSYANQGYTKYVGKSGSKQILDTRSYSYQVPRQVTPTVANGTMTPNGIAMPVADQPATTAYAGYARRFADFQFKTGVNSILEWDDMIFNEIEVGARHNFSLRNFDMFAYAEYTYGMLDHGGLSMDYDLEPFDPAEQDYGIFTISMGDLSGKTNHFKFGIGAHHIWDIAGWKLSPSIGYEIFKHNLEMSNHYYPNPAIYLPLLTEYGDYVFGDDAGNYYSVPQNAAAPEEWYQVCMSPEDILLVQAPNGSGIYDLGTSLTTGPYSPSPGNELLPWGVGPGECVIVGGDGPVIVEGTTHIYNTTWSGFYIGLEVEKQMTTYDKLRFYFQFGLPKYSSEGIWPNRTDWQQNPSFLDEGSNGSYSYSAEMEYNLRLSDRMQLALKIDTNVFHVGEIPGKLYLAEYVYWALDDEGNIMFDDSNLPYIETVPASTEHVSKSLKEANWQSFGLHLGIKYSF